MGEYNQYISEYNEPQNDEYNNTLVKKTNQTMKYTKQNSQQTKNPSSSRSFIAQIIILVSAVVLASQTIFSTKVFEIKNIEVDAHQVVVEFLNYEEGYTIEVVGQGYQDLQVIQHDEIYFWDLQANRWYQLMVYDEQGESIYQYEFKTKQYVPLTSIKNVVIDSFSYGYNEANDSIIINILMIYAYDIEIFGYMLTDIQTNQILEKDVIQDETFDIDVSKMTRQKNYRVSIYYLDDENNEVIIENYRIYF